MKKFIVLLAVIVCLPGMARAEWVNVFGSGDSRIIYTFHDNGDVTSSSAYRTGSGWMIFDDHGNTTMVNDYSRNSDGDRDRPSDKWGTPSAFKPFVPFE
jgi:hypothetical protein